MSLLVQSTLVLVLFCVYLGNAHPFSTFKQCITRKNAEYEEYFNKGDIDSLMNKVFHDGKLEDVKISLKTNSNLLKLGREGASKAYRALKATGIKQVKINSILVKINTEAEGTESESGKMVFTYEGAVNKTVQYFRIWKKADNMEWRILSEDLIWE